MTQQYLAGELSVLLERVQAVTTTDAARCQACSLRHEAETEPVRALRWVTVRALALTEGCAGTRCAGETPRRSPVRRRPVPRSRSSESARAYFMRLRPPRQIF